MRLSLGLDQRQIQTQKLAPRMIQSMEILQLPILALQERIEQEINENPLLEVQEVDPTLPDEPVERENPDAPAEPEREMVVDESKDNAEDFERLVGLQTEVPDHFDDGPRRSLTRIEEEADRKQDAMANVASRPESLNDYLIHQVGELDLDPELEAMAGRIISALDAHDGGYLKSSLEDLLPPDATPEQLELAPRHLKLFKAWTRLALLREDLRECLLLQLSPQMPYYDELKTLISGHLDDLRDNRLPQIERKTGYSIKRIQEAWEQLKKLNPKPGSEFAEAVVPNVTPDVFLEQNEDGTYRVILEDSRTPRLYISDYYRQRLASGQATAEEKEYIKRKVNSAQWLIDSIEQRRSTLTKVAQAIVDHQKKFLDDGPEAIIPLKMQQIADTVGVHVTTVSRAVDDKWIQTPRGIFPLKRFFVGGTQGEDGDNVAWDRIRLKLQELIDKEDKRHPYSDDDLVKELKKVGMPVARRTVTKYRQKMKIPSSRQRRDWSKE